MDIFNFISWIAGKKRVVNSIPEDSLIPVGVRTNTRDDKYVTVAIKLSDFINSTGLTEPNLGPVLSNIIDTPPSNSDNGDRYIVPSGSTGAWSGQTNNIAEWNEDSQTWGYYIPVSGDRTIVTTGPNAGKVYEFNGLSWIEQAVPTTQSTPFYLGGTNIDAGSNKTSPIRRSGNLLIGGSSTTSTIYKFRVVGQSHLDMITTRLAYSSTNDPSKTNNWYKILAYKFNASDFISDTFKLLMTDSGNSNGAGTQVEFNVTIKKQNTSVFCSVLIDQKSRYFANIENNFEILYNDTTKELNFYYKPTQNYSISSWAVLANRNNGNTGNFAWVNEYLNVATLAGEVSDPATILKNVITYSLITATGVETEYNGQTNVVNELSIKSYSPTQITTNRNNYPTVGQTTLRLSADVLHSITGFAGGYDGKILMVHIIGPGDIQFIHNSASSLAENRFLLKGGLNYTAEVDECLMFQYDGVDEKWRLVS